MDTFNVDEVGLVFKLIGKLQGDKGDAWLKELGKFLQGRNTWDGVEDLTTINIGTRRNVEELLKNLESNQLIAYLGYNIDSVKKRVASIVTSEKVIQLDLVTATPEDLGLGKHFDYSKWESICEAAIKRGFIVCPEEAALQLLVQYKGALREWLSVITQPTFCIEHAELDKLWKYEVGNNGAGKYFIRPNPDKVELANYAKCVFIRCFKEVES